MHRPCDTGDGVVLLTDMFGGTPSNLAISLMERQGVEVIAGVNLPMLVKLAKVRSKQPLADAVNCAEEAGRKYIAAASHVLHNGCKAQRHAADDAADGDLPPRERENHAVGRPITAGPRRRNRLHVPNKRGLHARAAAKFVILAERFDASVDVIRDGQSVPARSIMGLMMLGAGQGADDRAARRRLGRQGGAGRARRAGRDRLR